MQGDISAGENVQYVFPACCGVRHVFLFKPLLLEPKWLKNNVVSRNSVPFWLRLGKCRLVFLQQLSQSYCFQRKKDARLRIQRALHPYAKGSRAACRHCVDKFAYNFQRTIIIIGVNN